MVTPLSSVYTPTYFSNSGYRLLAQSHFCNTSRILLTNEYGGLGIVAGTHASLYYLVAHELEDVVTLSFCLLSFHPFFDTSFNVVPTGKPSCIGHTFLNVIANGLLSVCNNNYI